LNLWGHVFLHLLLIKKNPVHLLLLLCFNQFLFYPKMPKKKSNRIGCFIFLFLDSKRANCTNNIDKTHIRIF